MIDADLLLIWMNKFQLWFRFRREFCPVLPAVFFYFVRGVYFYSSDDKDADEDKNRGKIKSKPTEALTLSEFWVKYKVQRKQKTSIKFKWP